MKRCSKCERMLDDDQFSFTSREKGTRQSWCKECMRAYAKGRKTKDWPDAAPEQAS